MTESSRFRIPVKPERSVTERTVTIDGRVIFTLEPSTSETDIDTDTDTDTDTDIEDVVSRILSADDYVAGDWFDLPRPVYLVYDVRLGTVFRVRLTETAIELMVLPSTEAEGLARFYRNLRATSAIDWSITRSIEPPRSG